VLDVTISRNTLCVVSFSISTRDFVVECYLYLYCMIIKIWSGLIKNHKHYSNQTKMEMRKTAAKVSMGVLNVMRKKII